MVSMKYAQSEIACKYCLIFPSEPTERPNRGAAILSETGFASSPEKSGQFGGLFGALASAHASKSAQHGADLSFGSSTALTAKPPAATDNAALDGVDGCQNDPSVLSPTQTGLVLRFEDGVPIEPSITLTRRLGLAIKRCMDVGIALTALVFLGPMLLFVAIAIMATSPGPVLFRQIRTGVNGKPFLIFKFRTMRTELGDASGTAQTRADDHRLTPIGGFLRRKSIDELPQLLNVLIGDMSLVGPRPHVPGMLAAGVLYEELVPYYGFRHCMKPGITGWAQANGYRGPTDDQTLSKARVDHDIAYIQNFSVRLDIVTLARTVWRELAKGTGL